MIRQSHVPCKYVQTEVITICWQSTRVSIESSSFMWSKSMLNLSCLVLSKTKRKELGIFLLFSARRRPYLQHFFQTILHLLQIFLAQIHQTRCQKANLFLLLSIVHVYFGIGNRIDSQHSTNQVVDDQNVPICIR